MADQNNNKPAEAHESGIQTEDIIDSDELLELDISLDDLDDPQDDEADEILAGDMEALPDLPAFTDELEEISLDDITADEKVTPEPQAESAQTENEQAEHKLTENEQPETEPVEDEQESVSSLEKDLEHMMDWDEPTNDIATATEKTDESISPENNIAASEPLMQSATASPGQPTTAPVSQSPVEPAVTEAPKKARFSLDIANSIMFSFGLIAILVAALAVWIGLKASQDAANAALAPKQIQQQVTTLEKQQEQQNLILMQQIETLQQQLNDLTTVIAGNRTAQWRSNMNSRRQQSAAPETVATTEKTEAVKKPAPASKSIAKKPIPTAKSVNSASVPSVLKSKPVSAPLSAFEVAPGTVKGWVLNIESVESKKKAEREIRHLKKIDIHAEYVRVPVKGKIWFRIRVSGFNNEREAVTLKKFLKEYHGIDAWHSKLK